MALSKETIQNLRQEYKAARLSENEVAPDPISQFAKWFTEAMDGGIFEPNAMTVATATPDGKPSARIMLMKGFDESGFTFYTNYLSRKGRELNKNPNAALLFFWGELERQVRIEGHIEKVSKEDSERYFHSRPKQSQLGALASQQSQEVGSREVLESALERLQTEYQDKEVPKPSHWGGYIVKPQIVEFWQGGPGRLHDRIVYKKTNKNTWKIVRLAP
ncbi:pyridoxamine 5'-phosphate oxidase [Pedobacter sp. SYSU D00535]|uniref:pyridoxamine 5'-phosphate oxidase n=1 Tax=Pedobacter sp. SYSU D00535 TaxID=2810308 RepID=UPI001A97BF76|nr:pyridoxamine 5'-phosphate oxidase [Pedobacter sp. SYSU D00535]